MQGNNEEKKKVYYNIPTDFPSQSQRQKTSSSKALTWDASCLEVARLNHDENVTLMNEVDSWIDMLDVFDTTIKTETQSLQNTEILMAWLLQQSLPRMQVPTFDGNPLQWLEFITKYKEIVHDQACPTNNQKFIYLMQHVDGEAKRALQVFSTNKEGYIMALKRIKYMFGQRTRISQAYIAKLTRGKSISNDDDKSLLEFYYTMSDCVAALNQLQYIHHLHSSNVLKQALVNTPLFLKLILPCEALLYVIMACFIDIFKNCNI